MDIYQYVNSKDIRAHLEAIGYRFNALEAAWLVYECKNATMEEKHAAWREIIETMPDMEMGFKDYVEPIESLHGFLRDYTAMEQKWFQRFMTPKVTAVYEFEYYERKNDFQFNSCPFAEYDACIAAIKKRMAEYKNGEISPIIIRKINVCGVESGPSSVIVDPNGTVKGVGRWFPHDETECRLYDSFDHLWFDFPLPFKEGDIVYDPNGNEKDFCDGPFVLMETAVDVFTKTIPADDTAVDMYRKTYGRICGTMEMTAYGYFQEEAGTLYAECMHHYMDLERYPEEKLTGKKRILKALSNHLKGEIDAVLFARAYHQILLEESARESLPRDITDEGMRLAGLKEEETE